jgi:GNAT superfamily N-acetyltransferase
MLTIRQFTVSDIDFGMRLKHLAKWNQTPADWHRAIALEPNGCFVGQWNGTDVASLTCCLFDDIAWIAMVLTDPEYRGRGIAGGLMRHAIQYLTSRGARCIRLDATEFGLPVYQKLGFTIDWPLTRFGGVPQLQVAVGYRTFTPLSAEDLAAACELDQAATATVRRTLLKRLFDERDTHPQCARDGSRITGFAFRRLGSNATQIGPCVAAPDADAGEFMTFVCDSYAVNKQRIYIDIPDTNDPARQWAVDAGLTAERQFYRMTLGPKIAENTQAIWASYGPEKG